MTKHPRIFALSICVLFALTAESQAAGKRRSSRHGKWKEMTPTQEAPAKSAPGGAPEAAAVRNGGASPDVRAAEGRASTTTSVRQESRIEFDERMLRGQSASGVIYLFQRTPSDWKSIVEVPGSFRERSVRVLNPVEAKK